MPIYPINLLQMFLRSGPRVLTLDWPHHAFALSPAGQVISQAAVTVIRAKRKVGATGRQQTIVA